MHLHEENLLLLELNPFNKLFLRRLKKNKHLYFSLQANLRHLTENIALRELYLCPHQTTNK